MFISIIYFEIKRQSIFSWRIKIRDIRSEVISTFGYFGFLCSFLVTFGITRFIKASVARVRPNNVESLQEVIRILQEPTYYSFVSGHTSTSMAITTFMVLILRHRYKWVYLFYLWPILFATSRVYVGVHYPSDLAAGAFVGVIIAIIIYKICKKMLARGDREFDEL